ncbi:MAG TPA: SDR family NAD(P)-dependent oxidoreductase [Acidimicrobiales bacterium]|nr:SDR family NAD(P)-dependent oxidoreductase [Acidimicrobiales bacterium]
MGLLDGKVALVTGAGHGIGRGEALELARQGAKVVVNDVGGSVHGEGADKRPAEDVAEVIRSRGGEASANFDDVADWAGAQSLVRQAVEDFGRLDIVVNNAGIVRDAMLFSMTEEAFDAVVRVHLKGTFAVTHHAANYWREESKAGRQPRAAIVNTVSSAGLQGNVGQANYGSAKAGIAALTVISSLELSRYGVRANAVAPGGMTRITATLTKTADVKEPDELDTGEGEYDRMNPANSAPMVAWLASDEALHVTGQVFRAVGHTITHYKPWSLGATIETKGGPARWEPADIGAAVNAQIFGSRAAGLQMGG